MKARSGLPLDAPSGLDLTFSTILWLRTPPACDLFMPSERRHTVASLIRDYRSAARAGAWDLCHLACTELYSYRLSDDVRRELIYADGYQREMRGDTDNARRCYELAAAKGHPKAARRLDALGGPVPPVEPLRH